MAIFIAKRTLTITGSARRTSGRKSELMFDTGHG